MAYNVIYVRRIQPLEMKLPAFKVRFAVSQIDKVGFVQTTHEIGSLVKKYLKLDVNILHAFVFINMEMNNFICAYPFQNQLIFDEKTYRFTRLYLRGNLSKVLVPAVYSAATAFDSLDLAVSSCCDFLIKSASVSSEQLSLALDGAAPF